MILLRTFQRGDEQVLLHALQRILGSGTPEGHPRTMETWRWRYEQNPAGRGTDLILLALDETGGVPCVVGQFAGTPVRLYDRGTMRMGVHAADQMVDPKVRQGLRRPGLLVQMAREWCRLHLHPGIHEVVYGFPNVAHFRIGRALARYEVVRTQTILYCEPLGVPRRGHGVDVEEFFNAGPEFDSFFNKVAGEFSLTAWRDAQYVRWRYLDHPEFKYRLFVARDAQGIRGWMVVRHCDWLVARNCIIIDWLVPAGDMDAARELLYTAENLRCENGGACISTMISESSAWFRSFQLEGWLVAPTEFICCIISGGRDQRPSVLRRDWYYCHGDFDHV